MDNGKQSIESGNLKIKNQANPPMIKKGEIVVICILLIVALFAIGLFLFAKNSSTKTHLVFTISGNVEEIFNLGEYNENKVVDLSINHGITASLEFENNQARFINVDCPDHICENSGWVDSITEGAICIPNRMSIRVVSNEEYKDINEEK